MSKRKNESEVNKAIRLGQKNHHHFCFPRRSWNIGGRLNLRRMHYCIAVLPKKLHNRIHIEIGVVSIPPEEVAEEVARKVETLLVNNLVSCSDPPEERLRMLGRLFSEKAPWTANALYEQARIIDEYNRRLP